MNFEKAKRRILEAMLEQPDEWWYGLDVFEAAGYGPLRSGACYPALYSLEGEGMLESMWDVANPQTGLRRRLYRLTENGKRIARSYKVDTRETKRIERARPGFARGGLLRPAPGV